MKKKEIMILVAVISVIAILFLGVKWSDSLKNKDAVKVIYQTKNLLEFDPNKDGEYWFDGSYGKLMVEVKDSMWRVTNEECPNHVCSSIGWVSIDDYFPIICLPNEISVELK